MTLTTLQLYVSDKQINSIQDIISLDNFFFNQLNFTINQIWVKILVELLKIIILKLVQPKEDVNFLKFI